MNRRMTMNEEEERDPTLAENHRFFALMLPDAKVALDVCEAVIWKIRNSTDEEILEAIRTGTDLRIAFIAAAQAHQKVADAIIEVARCLKRQVDRIHHIPEMPPPSRTQDTN
jgi:hypothetical protein